MKTYYIPEGMVFKKPEGALDAFPEQAVVLMCSLSETHEVKRGLEAHLRQDRATIEDMKNKIARMQTELEMVKGLLDSDQATLHRMCREEMPKEIDHNILNSTLINCDYKSPQEIYAEVRSGDWLVEQLDFICDLAKRGLDKDTHHHDRPRFLEGILNVTKEAIRRLCEGAANGSTPRDKLNGRPPPLPTSGS